MDEKKLIKVIEELKNSKKKFVQSFDLLVSLKDLNLKNPNDQVEFFAQLPNNVGKKKKVCALIAPEMNDAAKEIMDFVVLVDDFPKYDKKKAKKLAESYDYFIGQANVMPKIAQTFGRFFGPRGKMPNPKAGCIVPPKMPLKPLYDKLQNIIKISIKKQPNLQLMVGKQDMPTEKIVQNINFIYDQLIHHLPKEENNIKTIYLKLTMTKPIKL